MLGGLFARGWSSEGLHECPSSSVKGATLRVKQLRALWKRCLSPSAKEKTLWAWKSAHLLPWGVKLLEALQKSISPSTRGITTVELMKTLQPKVLCEVTHLPPWRVKHHGLGKALISLHEGTQWQLGLWKVATKGLLKEPISFREGYNIKGLEKRSFPSMGGTTKIGLMEALQLRVLWKYLSPYSRGKTSKAWKSAHLPPWGP